MERNPAKTAHKGENTNVTGRRAWPWELTLLLHLGNTAGAVLTRNYMLTSNPAPRTRTAYTWNVLRFPLQPSLAAGLKPAFSRKLV